MDIPLDEVIYVEAIASSSTGAAVDADSTPTFAVFEESTDTDIGVGGNMTKRTSLTGNYRASFTASAANGFEVGKWYSVIGSATIGTIATKGVLKTFRIVAAEAIAGKPKVDVDALLGTAWLTPTVAGTPDVNTIQVSGDGTAADTLELFIEALDQATGQIDAGTLANNTLTASALAANAVAEIQSGLSTLTAANVNAEVLDVLQTDTFAELAAVPAATSSLKDKIVWTFQWLRNKSTQTATERKLYADDGSTVVSTETVSDDGATYTKGEAS